MSTQVYLQYVVIPILILSELMVFVRFLKGPSVIDRVVALDLIVTIGIGIISIYSMITDTSNFLDIAMILALIAFLGTVAFSYYLEKRNKND
jgi:multicomponent Na+:H+ antiporter subunit F